MSELEYCNPACDPECGGRPDSDCFKSCGRFANIAVKVIDDKQSVNKHTDKELLILAARAAGFDVSHSMNTERLELNPPIIDLWVELNGRLVSTGWNPLQDDGHALRLAVKMKFDVMTRWGEPNSAILDQEGNFTIQADVDLDMCAATRRAIVRAAAAIGEKL